MWCVTDKDILRRLEKGRRILLVRLQLIVYQEELLVVALDLLMSILFAARWSSFHFLKFNFKLLETLVHSRD